MTSAKGVSKVEYLPTVTSANVRKTWERKSENEISLRMPPVAYAL